MLPTWNFTFSVLSTPEPSSERKSPCFAGLKLPLNALDWCCKSERGRGNGGTEKIWFSGTKTQFWGLMPFIWNFSLTGGITDRTISQRFNMPILHLLNFQLLLSCQPTCHRLETLGYWDSPSWSISTGACLKSQLHKWNYPELSKSSCESWLFSSVKMKKLEIFGRKSILHWKPPTKYIWLNLSEM